MAASRLPANHWLLSGGGRRAGDRELNAVGVVAGMLYGSSRALCRAVVENLVVRRPGRKLLTIRDIFSNHQPAIVPLEIVFSKMTGRYNRGVEYEETYRGERIVISTEQQADGSWKSKSAWVKADKRVTLETRDERYPSEEAARTAARSAAAEAIDRARASTGKP